MKTDTGISTGRGFDSPLMQSEVSTLLFDSRTAVSLFYSIRESSVEAEGEDACTQENFWKPTTILLHP